MVMRTTRRRLVGFGLVLAVLVGLSPPRSAEAEDAFITLGSTTSTEQSGLFDDLLPAFQKATGIAVRVVAVGTGQALRLGERGDCDALLVHDPEAEEAFMAKGFGIDRRPVMHNDFVIVGPASDPAGIGGGADAVAAFGRIAAAQAPFLSRGDDSGTHAAEKRLWATAAIAIKPAPVWYHETGSGMGPTLNTAAGLDAYVLADRGTWANFKNRGALTILVQGDRRLFNPYHVMLVNPARHPQVKTDLARRFADWLTAADGQAAISAYRIGGETLFFPDTQSPRS